MITTLRDEIQKSQNEPVPGLSMLFEVIPRQLVQTCLAETQRQEIRHRKLTAELVVWLCLAISWMPRRAIQSVLSKLCQITSLAYADPTAITATPSAISQARYRLGPKPLEVLFKRVCRPLAEPQTQGAFRYGKRLVGIDGTLEQVADTPTNDAYFGRSSGSHGDNAFPQMRAVYACELGTHIIFDAVVGGYRRGEPTLAKRLVRSLDADMLVFLDAGLASFDLFHRVVARGSDIIARSNAHRQWRPIRQWPDGTFLALMKPTDKSADPHVAPLVVRVIRYRLEDENRPHHGEVQTLITTLLDPQAYPALAVIDLYHERWEVEIAIDEMDTHQRLANRPFRSLKPQGVLQEFYAFLLAYFVIRCLILRTAHIYDIDPDRLSFIETVHLVVDSLPLFALAPVEQHASLWQWLMAWIAHYQLPPRRDRSNPRVIKKRRTKFPRKQPHHFAWPQPAKPFRDACVVLT